MAQTELEQLREELAAVRAELARTQAALDAAQAVGRPGAGEPQHEETKALVRLMMGQLRPHFLFNCITAIMAQCRRSPADAQDSLVDFSDYLRVNIQALELDNVQLFDAELEHIESYMRLEKLRFKDRLQVIYDIDPVDFPVPVLSVQPLMENAVKHGLMQRESGGTVTLSTRETDSEWLVTVRDDGIGFDPAVPLPADGRPHEGLRAVRRRLALCPGSRIAVQSAPGQGTCVTITFPKGGAGK